MADTSKVLPQEPPPPPPASPSRAPRTKRRRGKNSALMQNLFDDQSTAAATASSSTGRSNSTRRKSEKKGGEQPLGNGDDMKLEGGLYDSHVVDNPIGALLDVCVSRKWQLPHYTVEKYQDMGTVYASYYATCTVSIYRVNGTGITVEEAKKDAAYNMYQEIIDVLELEFRERPLRIRELIVGVERVKISLPYTQQAFKKYFDMLKFISDPATDKKKNLDTIKKNKLKCVEVLELVGKLEGFNAKYFIVRQKTGNRFDRVQIVLYLTTKPPMYVKVSGDTIETAQESAAYDILMYFGSML